MEDGDVADLLQAALNLKAARGGDVLQVHAAKAPGQELNGAHDLVHVLASHTERDGVHATKGLEEHALALHHGHACLGANVTQAQDGSSVGHYSHGIPAPRQLIALVDVLLNLKAGLRNARGIGNAQRLRGAHVGAKGNLDLAFQLAVQAQ